MGVCCRRELRFPTFRSDTGSHRGLCCSTKTNPSDKGGNGAPKTDIFAPAEQYVYSNWTTRRFRSSGAVCGITIHSKPKKVQELDIPFSIDIALLRSAEHINPTPPHYLSLLQRSNMSIAAIQREVSAPEERYVLPKHIARRWRTAS